MKEDFDHCIYNAYSEESANIVNNRSNTIYKRNFPTRERVNFTQGI